MHYVEAMPCRVRRRELIHTLVSQESEELHKQKQKNKRARIYTN
jgi:hypothetical protein